MIEIIKELNIEVSKPNVFQAVVAKQYDMNTRFIKATFVDNGDKIHIDPNATVKVFINALRPDGEAKGFDGKVNQDGTVTVPLHSWMLEQVGTVTCDISVIDTETDDNKKLTTTSFTLFVEKAAWDGDGMTNDPQYNLLIELLNSCEAAGEMAEDALKKSTEANSKYDACVEATAAANKVVADNEAIIGEMNDRLDEAYAVTGLPIKGKRAGRRFLSLADVSPTSHLVTVKTTVDNIQQYNVKCAVMGKNLLRPEWLDMSNWDTSDGANNTYEITHLAPGNYVFSLNCPGDSIPSDVFSLQISGNDFGTIDTEHWLYGSRTYNEGTPYRREVTFTVNEGDRVRLWLDTIYYSSPADYNCTECQIECGSVATVYEAPVVRDEWIADGTLTREIGSWSPAMNFVTFPTHGNPDLSLVRFDVQYKRDIGLALDEIARVL